MRVPLTPSWSVGGRAGAGYVLSGLAAQADGYDVTGVDGPAIGLGLSTWLAL